MPLWPKQNYCVQLQLVILSDQIRNLIPYEIAFVFHYQSVPFKALKLSSLKWNMGEKKKVQLQYMSELLQGSEYVTLAEVVECFWSLCKWILSEVKGKQV